MSFWISIASLVLLFGLEWIYIRVARKAGIVDNPNYRTLHDDPTVRGGGVIFYFAAAFYFVFGTMSGWIFVALTLVSVTGMLDDIHDLPASIRFAVQIIAFGILFWDLGLLNHVNVLFLFAWFVAVCAINAFNFMDGINGITGGYSMVTLASLLVIDQTYIDFIDESFLIIMMLSVLVFIYFNFRTKAVAFAGDVGSITIAFIILYLLVLLVYKTGNIIFVMFLALYGVDTFLTILHRIMRRENIFQAHRLHLFQVIVFHHKVSHITMSLAYALVQLAINILIIYNLSSSVSNQYITGAVILIALGILYTLTKIRILRRFQEI